MPKGFENICWLKPKGFGQLYFLKPKVLSTYIAWSLKALNTYTDWSPMALMTCIAERIKRERRHVEESRCCFWKCHSVAANNKKTKQRGSGQKEENWKQEEEFESVIQNVPWQVAWSPKALSTYIAWRPSPHKQMPYPRGSPHSYADYTQNAHWNPKEKKNIRNDGRRNDFPLLLLRNDFPLLLKTHEHKR